MSTVERVYQETKDLPETEARDVLGFVKFLKSKRRCEFKGSAKFQHSESDLENADMSEFDQFGSVYDGQFDRDACYDWPHLR